ncbi:beta-glucosidase [Oscillospiraceae bacterium HV4-5-C5C]|nr:beta-glucosidase [Oscillospiraceae bacterium HV4-5-C5C]
MNNEKQSYLNPSLPPEVRADQLLACMDNHEKLAQLTAYNPASWSNDHFPEAFPYGVGQVSYLFATEDRSLTEVLQQQREIQSRIMELSPHTIPAIFHLETLSGALLPEASSFPCGIAQGATFNPPLLRQMAALISRQARMAGATQGLSPVLDVNRDQRFGRCGESFGEDPVLAAALGMAVTQGLQGPDCSSGLLATAKHFLAYHHAMGGIHAAAVDLSDRLLADVYAKPFQAAVMQAGLKGIMPSYGALNGVPPSVSEPLLRGLLRHTWGFKGLIVSDYCAISEAFSRQHFGESLSDTGAAALKAGLDQELPSPLAYSSSLLEQLASDQILARAFDQSVWRVLYYKFKLGLFEKPLAEDSAKVHQFYQQVQHQQLAQNVASDAIVLLKNRGILPLRTAAVKRIALVGPHAGSTLAGFGGYTYASMRCGFAAGQTTMAGLNLRADAQVQRKSADEALIETIARQAAPRSRPLYQTLQEQLPELEITFAPGYPYLGGDESGFEQALLTAAKADLIILTLGGRYGTGTIATEGEGLDRSTIELPPAQENFIKAAAALNKPLIMLHFGGHPLVSDAADRYADAILECWTLGEGFSQAIVAVLLGQTAPGGRLPVSVPYKTGQIPLTYCHPYGSSWHQGTMSAVRDYVDCPHQVRYPFGYGLTYTDFDYSALVVKSAWLSRSEPLQLQFSLKNTGAYRGKETVQLYIRDEQASVVRPNMLLLAFRKYDLQPGETKIVAFSIPLEQLVFKDQQGRWKAEAGQMTVLIGRSSADIRLQTVVQITQDEYYSDTELSYFEG